LRTFAYKDSQGKKHRLLPDEDLKEVYFKRIFGFKEKSFLLSGWESMPLSELQAKLDEGIPNVHDIVWKAKRKRDLMKMFRPLLYVPLDIYCGLRYVVKTILPEICGKRPPSDISPENRDMYLGLICGYGMGTDPIDKIHKLGLTSTGLERAVMTAAGHGHVETITYLVKSFKAPVTLEALFDAAAGGQVDACRELVKVHGVDPGAVGRTGSRSMAMNQQEWTPLTCAANSNRVNVAKFLVEECGVDIEKTVKNASAICWSARSDSVDVARYLASKGARITSDSTNAAANHLNREMFDVLVEGGADPSACDEFGRGAFAYTIMPPGGIWMMPPTEQQLRDHDESAVVMLEHLLEKYPQMDVNQPGWRGQTPLDLAESGNFPKCAAMLKLHGGRPGMLEPMNEPDPSLSSLPFLDSADPQALQDLVSQMAMSATESQCPLQ
jgi:hypothetical protein